tara:strand:- start:500 stop:712 length:213 start_codon:yes stop_codon:yes gene_type:complete
MKYFLFIFLCTGIGGECMPPMEMQQSFDSKYSCLVQGYETSKNMMIDIGEEDINKNDIYIKFVCTPKVEI